jgi:TonB family protein
MGLGMSVGSPSGPGQQGDTLLWVAGGVLAAVVLAWLALTRPWSSEPQVTLPAASAIPVMLPEVSVPAASPGELTDEAVSNPLRLAELAFEAGMLLEPEAYSAWALYQRALQLVPGDPIAVAGLERVVSELLRRAEVALQQGRHADAQGLADTVLAALPGHERATALAASIVEAESRERAALEAAAAPPPARVAAAATGANRPAGSAAARPAVEPDPLASTLEEFDAALAAGRLLAPADRNAIQLLASLMQLGPSEPRTGDARARLSDALLDSAEDAIAALDADAATTWLREAAGLGVAPARIAALEANLVERLIAAESARPVPATALTLTRYSAPQYPGRALDRRIEGWVDLEFTIGTDGVPHDVTITDGSHENFFRSEAIRAVEQWRFEPREFHGRVIEQRSYTRIRFAVEQ